MNSQEISRAAAKVIEEIPSREHGKILLDTALDSIYPMTFHAFTEEQKNEARAELFQYLMRLVGTIDPDDADGNLKRALQLLKSVPQHALQSQTQKDQLQTAIRLITRVIVDNA